MALLPVVVFLLSISITLTYITLIQATPTSWPDETKLACYRPDNEGGSAQLAQ